ncbi:MAG: sigma-70 family RNA polymerase sigma factor [Nitrospirae bacterium]|nr:sigma-70 family RNA polymerase sigma factor [Nitrospirota bacterium]
MSESSPDFSLLAECVNGKPEAWDTFVDQYSKLVYHSINNTLKLHHSSLQQEDVEDIFNGIFLSFMEDDYKKLRQYEARHGCTLSSWIRLISIRSTIDYLRGQKHHVSIDDDNDGSSFSLVETLPDERATAEKQMELSETDRLIRQAIDELPASDKLFIELHYEKELPAEEIAEIMNISVNTLYSRKNRIHEKIKKIIKEKEIPARNQE